MLLLTVYFAIAAFVGVTIIGNILIFRAMFAQADHVSLKHDKNQPRGYFSGYGA
jgi:hypothetical protein